MVVIFIKVFFILAYAVSFLIFCAAFVLGPPLLGMHFYAKYPSFFGRSLITAGIVMYMTSLMAVAIATNTPIVTWITQL